MRKGERMSEAQKTLISLKKKGQPSYWKGKKFPPEMRAKMSLAKKGKPSSFKGKKMSLQSRKKMSKARKAYFKRLNPNYKYLPNPKDDRKWLRRERVKKYGGFHSIGEWEILKAQYNWTCPSCKEKEPEIKLTRDHIIAISSGGSDNIQNIQPLCATCNSKKNTKTIRY